MENTLQTADGQSLSYRHIPGKNEMTMIFMHGTMSDKNTEKSLFLEQFCKEKNMSYIAFDFTGHGQSSGKYTDGTIGKWHQNAMEIIDNVAKGPVVLVGSSMGGWVSLLAARSAPEKVKGVVGLAAAADFTKNIWNNFSPEQKAEMNEKGIVYTPNGWSEKGDPWTKQLFEEAKKHFVLNGTGSLDITCPMLLIQGDKDNSVSVKTAFDIKDAAKSKESKVVVIENGGHRLSSPRELSVIKAELNTFLTGLEAQKSNTASVQKIIDHKQKHRQQNVAAKSLKIKAGFQR